MTRYMTAAQEWSEEFNRLHAQPGTRTARVSRQGARILQMLSPYPWEAGHGDVDFDVAYNESGEAQVTLKWQPAADDFVVGHAHQARSTGFPEGDAKRILAGFRRGQARTRPGHPDSRGERIHIAARLTRRSGRRRYRGR